jgi:hypothetical protein
VNRFGGDTISILFDYQRFRGDQGLERLIEETQARCALNVPEPVALPDSSVGALAGVGEEQLPVLCAWCGAVFPDEAALQAHILGAHRP